MINYSKYIKLVVFMVLGAFVSQASLAQETTPPKEETQVETIFNNKFRTALLKAANESAKSGDIRRVDVVRLRVASLSPAFLERAEELALIQMSFSGEEVPVDADGKIEASRIYWEGLIKFLEYLVPVLLKLLDMFAMSGIDVETYVVLQDSGHLVALFC